jgi:hypothetical protein
MTGAFATKPLSAPALLFDYGMVPLTPIIPNHTRHTRLQVDSLLETLSITQSPVNTLNSAGSLMFSR